MVISKILVAKIAIGSVIVSASISYVAFAPSTSNLNSFSDKNQSSTATKFIMLSDEEKIERYDYEYREDVSLTGSGFSQTHVGRE